MFAAQILVSDGAAIADNSFRLECTNYERGLVNVGMV